MSEFISFLNHRLKKELPGPEAQFRMSPPRTESKYRTPASDAKKAAVMVLFYYKDQDLTFVIIERSASHPRDKHGGQLSLPGGKYEDTDIDLAHCALRETQEEIGIMATDIRLIGALTPIYVFVSNFAVSPYIGFLDSRPTFLPQPSEVSAILEVSIVNVFHPSSKGIKRVQAHDLLIPNMPYYDLEGKTLWGATAMVLSEVEALYTEFLAVVGNRD